MSHEAPKLHFNYVPPIERIAPGGLDPEGVAALVAPYPIVETGRYAKREKLINENLKWAREASEHFLPSGQSVVASVAHYDNPHRKSHWYYAYSTSESVVSALYALRPHFEAEEREKRKRENTEALVGQVVTRFEGETADELVWWRFFDKDHRTFERRRSEAANALAQASIDFYKRYNRLYFNGLRDPVKFAYPHKDQSGVVDMYQQYIDYFGDDTQFRTGPGWGAPMFNAIAIMPKLLPLIPETGNDESGPELLAKLAQSSHIVSNLKTMTPAYGRSDKGKLDLHRDRAKDITEQLLRRGYAQYIRSYLPQVSLPENAYEGIAPEHRRKLVPHPEDF